MRRIQYIAVMVCLLSTAVWMSWWGSYSPALNQVDSLFAASRFTEARHKLDSLHTGMMRKGKAVRMRYNLLSVKTDGRLGIRQQSDSLILAITDYYEHGGAKAYLKDAYCWAGNTYRDLNDAHRALEYYQKALDEMGEVQEPGILQIKELVYEQMGHLFFRPAAYGTGP